MLIQAIKKSVSVAIAGSMIASLAFLAGCCVPADVVECRVFDNPGLKAAVLEIAKKADAKQGEKVSCMLMPDSIRHVDEGKSAALDGVALSGLTVKVALGSADEEKIARYKGLLGGPPGSKTFAVAASDQALFQGVQYIVVYKTGTKSYQTTTPGIGQRMVHDSVLELLFYWVQDGSYVGSVTASSKCAASPGIDHLKEQIGEALRSKGLPGTTPLPVGG